MNNLILSYQSYKKRVNEISSYVTMTMSQSERLLSLKELPLSPEQNSYVDYLRSLSSSTIQYNAVIISLYGCFENYIDELLIGFIDLVIDNTPNYDELPVKIKDKYRTKLGDYLTSPQRFNDIDIELNTVIKNYNSLLESDMSSIDKVFLLSHSGNLRFKQIDILFKDLGISDVRNKIFKVSLFKDYHINVVGLEDIDYITKKSRDNDDLFIYLDKLVEQRNYVAHGWSEDNRMSIHDIENYVIPFMLILGEILLRICLTETFDYLDEADYSFLNKEPIIVHNKRILCINNQGQNIKIGDFLIFKTNSEIKCTRICGIEIEKNKVESTNRNHSNVGFELDENIKKTDIVCHILGFDNYS